MKWLSEHLGDIVELIGALIAAATAIAGMVSSDAQTKVGKYTKGIVGFLSLVTHKDLSGTFKLPLTKQPEK